MPYQIKEKISKYSGAVALLTTSTVLMEPSQSYAQDWLPDLSATVIGDARAALGSDDVNWQKGGLGKTRFGRSQNSSGREHFKLAEAGLLVRAKFGFDVEAVAHLQYAPEQTKTIDLVEAYLTYQPLSLSDFATSAKVGLFYPPVSMEHVDVGWNTPYSITPSAMNSWIGEEVKSLNLQLALEHRGQDWVTKLSGALLTKNDPTGTMLTWRGWALHDRKISWQDVLPLADLNSLADDGAFAIQDKAIKPHREIDDRIGIYAKLESTYQEWLTLAAFHYDNRGDPTIFVPNEIQNTYGTSSSGIQILADHSVGGNAPVRGEYAWDTRFQAAGVNALMPNDFEIIAQAMTGLTEMGGNTPAGRPMASVRFNTAYGMLVKTLDQHQLSARFDWFEAKDRSMVIEDNNNENGYALMAAYGYQLDQYQRLMAEVLHVNSKRENRVDLGLPLRSKENQIQISYRVIF